MIEKTPGDFEEIVKKFHNNFGDSNFSQNLQKIFLIFIQYPTPL